MLGVEELGEIQKDNRYTGQSVKSETIIIVKREMSSRLRGNKNINSCTQIRLSVCKTKILDTPETRLKTD